MTAYRLLPITWLLLILTAGCAGPMALRHSRQNYNEAIQETSGEQLLLNLVRLRYGDRPSFLELTSVSTQFTFEEASSLGIDIPESALDKLSLGMAFAASERPTVTYDPLRGGEFVERLISPLKEETIILLIRSGWSIERILRMTVQDMNGLENARRASGPTPETISQQEYWDFLQAVNGLRDLQIQNKIRVGYEESTKYLSGAIPESQVNADSFVEAARQGWKLQPKQERVSIKVEKIAASSDAAADYLDLKLFSNLVDAVRERKSHPPIRVIPRQSWDAERYGKPGTRLFCKVDRKYSPDVTVDALPSGTMRLPAPDESQDAEDVPDRKPGTDKTFVAVHGEHSDLLLAAYRVAGVERIPCIVQFPDEFVLTGTSQSLVMNWDTDTLSSEDELLSLNLPGLKAVDEEQYVLSLEPRSLVGILYYLSHAIRVPLEHESCGLVPITTDEFGNVFDWSNLTGDLLSVYCSKKKPKCAAVAAKYRGIWFYIDDRDQRSKATFMLLSGLFELQAGGGATGTKPVLTLPVGI